jgi:5-oxoprolinase (ATP-hydrolysing) subunit C
MSIHVERAGLLTTVQAGPRTGRRHLGVPASGAADALALALANRLVGNSSSTPGLEVTLSGPLLLFDEPAVVALVGADCRMRRNGSHCPDHRAIRLEAGDRLDIGDSRRGVRACLALAGGLQVPAVLGSPSTYLPALLGGFDGRALAAGDTLRIGEAPAAVDSCETPEPFRPLLTHAWALRACPGGEADCLDEAQWTLLTGANWIVGRRADRMGIELQGPRLEIFTRGRLPSAAVFPGTLQCPESGAPFLLGCDAQTTGGYPRLLQVARADRHLIGQLRPGDRLRFLLRTPAEAARDLRLKHAAWRPWLPDIDAVV